MALNGVSMGIYGDTPGLHGALRISVGSLWNLWVSTCISEALRCFYGALWGLHGKLC